MTHHYFALFSKGVPDLRHDTRIYLTPQSEVTSNDFPIAAVIAKNPGSAVVGVEGNYGELRPLNLAKDQMLRQVKRVFEKAYAQAKRTLPPGGYIQIWNLFYRCESDLSKAKKNLPEALLSDELCKTETKPCPILWYAWGGADKKLNPLKKRFLGSQAQCQKSIYWDYSTKEVIRKKPSETSSVKHPQGMPHDKIVKELARLI
jgi:hypothetical protein